MNQFAGTNVFVLLFSALLLRACGGGSSNDKNTAEPPNQSASAKAYVAEILTIMQNNAVTRYIVDWGNLESEVNQLAANAQSIADTYPAITRALT